MVMHYGLRFYNPNAGRWLSRDPIGLRGGLNVYQFIMNNSLGMVDYLGLMWPGSDGKWPKGRPHCDELSCDADHLGNTCHTDWTFAGTKNEPMEVDLNPLLVTGTPVTYYALCVRPVKKCVCPKKTYLLEPHDKEEKEVFLLTDLGPVEPRFPPDAGLPILPEIGADIIRGRYSEYLFAQGLEREGKEKCSKLNEE